MRMKRGRYLLALLFLLAVWGLRLWYPQIREEAWQLTQSVLDRQGTLDQLVRTLGRELSQEGLTETISLGLQQTEGRA